MRAIWFEFKFEDKIHCIDLSHDQTDAVLYCAYLIHLH